MCSTGFFYSNESLTNICLVRERDICCCVVQLRETKALSRGNQGCWAAGWFISAWSAHGGWVRGWGEEKWWRWWWDPLGDCSQILSSSELWTLSIGVTQPTVWQTGIDNNEPEKSFSKGGLIQTGALWGFPGLPWDPSKDDDNNNNKDPPTQCLATQYVPWIWTAVWLDACGESAAVGWSLRGVERRLLYPGCAGGVSSSEIICLFAREDLSSG